MPQTAHYPSLQTEILNCLERTGGRKSDVIARIVGANIKQTRLALMSLSFAGKVNRSNRGIYRIAEQKTA